MGARRLSGANFSPWMESQNPTRGDVINVFDLWDRLEIVAGDAGALRTYSASSGLENCGWMMQRHGIEPWIGAWLGPAQQVNHVEVDRLIQQANAGTVAVAIVGNEVLLRGDLSEQDLIAHIRRVRREIPSHIPVVTAEPFDVYLKFPDLAAEIDFAFVNYYPFWHGIPVEHAVASVAEWHAKMEKWAQGKPVVVSETGWPSAGEAQKGAVPNLENAARYFNEFNRWAVKENVTTFWFSAMDEGWKINTEGSVGPHWGYRDRFGYVKPGFESWLPNDHLGAAPKLEVDHFPPVGTDGAIAGRIDGLGTPEDHRLATYIRVDGSWWTKPTWDEPTVEIGHDGEFEIDFTTARGDEWADQVAVFLVPEGYTPPRASGEPNLPHGLTSSAVAETLVDRSAD